MDCWGHLIDDHGIHADSDKCCASVDGAHWGTSTMCRGSSDLCKIWHILCQMYLHASCYTEEWSSVLVETHASSMHGQYKGVGMQGAYIMPNWPIWRQSNMGYLWCICIRDRCCLWTRTWLEILQTCRIYVQEIHSSSAQLPCFWDGDYPLSLKPSLNGRTNYSATALM